MPHTEIQNNGSWKPFALTHPLRFVGTSTSDWQLNPLHDESDWGEEVRRTLRGEETGIAPVRQCDLPSFDAHWREILQRASALRGNAFRLSLDFAELCPEPGVFRADVMARYVRILAECRRLGLTSVVTLHHWTQPKSFAMYDAGGRLIRGPLEHPGIVAHFRFYVERVAAYLADPAKVREALKGQYVPSVIDRLCAAPLVSWFVTVNEPMSLTIFPYVLGQFPPYRRWHFWKALRLEAKLRAMHRIAYEVFHDAARRAGFADDAAPKLGNAHGVVGSLLPVLNDLAGWGMVERMERDQETDFLGIHYYAREKLAFRWGWPPVSLRGFDPRMWSDSPGMEVYPPGVRDVLHRAARMYPGKPVFLSEFGFADRTDRKRPAWLLDTVDYIIHAAEEGVPLLGALLWSIADNFEWNFGMGVRFGVFGKDGNRLETDSGFPRLSSREVWSACSDHLLHPTRESAMHLEELRARAQEQLEEVAAEEERKRRGAAVPVALPEQAAG